MFKPLKFLFSVNGVGKCIIFFFTIRKDLYKQGQKWIAGVKLYGGPRASGLLNIDETNTFHHEYSALACTVEIVEDVYAAINHIHQHGRHVKFLQIIFIPFSYH